MRQSEGKKLKFNIVDVIVVLILAALVITLAMKFLPKKEAPEESPMEDSQIDDPQIDAPQDAVKYTVVCRMVNRDILPDAIAQVGAPLMSNGEIVKSCRVTKVEEAPFYESYVSGKGTLERQESEEYCNLYFTVSANLPYSGNAYHVGTQEVRSGKAHILKTAKLELNGTVVSITGNFGNTAAENN